jgi:hypothetical protein
LLPEDLLESLLELQISQVNRNFTDRIRLAQGMDLETTTAELDQDIRLDSTVVDLLGLDCMPEAAAELVLLVLVAMAEITQSLDLARPLLHTVPEAAEVEGLPAAELVLVDI